MYRTRGRRPLLAAALALAALALAGCGGGGAGGASAAGDAVTETAAVSARSGAAPARRQRPRTSAEPARQAGAACANRTGELLGALEGLRKRLVAGLDYRGYLERMRGLRATYDELAVERLPLACLDDVAAPAERALNRYIEALNLWAGCVEEAGCRAASVEVPLQHRWRAAARELGRAQRALR